MTIEELSTELSEYLSIMLRRKHDEEYEPEDEVSAAARNGFDDGVILTLRGIIEYIEED